MKNDQDIKETTPNKRLVEVEIISKRWGSTNTSSTKVIEVPIIGENTVRLDITVDLRKTDSIQIKPVRRNPDDVEGMIADAERLANS